MALREHAVAATVVPTIRVFGGIEVVHAGNPVNIGGARQRRLLALLVARSNTVVSLDWLAEHLWSDNDRPEDFVPPLRTYVSRLRSSLPEEPRSWLDTAPGGYRFVVPEGAIDLQFVNSLRARATQARESADPLTALDLLDRALEWWQGEPFIELEDVDDVRPTIERLALDRLETMEERWEVSLALGRHTQITGELAGFTAEHGLRDRGVRQYALALHRCGRTAEALRAITAHRNRLADESGLDPSPMLVKLESDLLAGGDALLVEKQGRPLRGYRLLEEIGQGAFSIVWRAQQPSVGRDVAIKQIRSELASQPDFIRRFEAEAHLVAAIEHPHVVPLIDYWRDPGSAYLVLRWLRGGTLERRLDDGPLSIAEALRLARQIGSALSSAHQQGVVHRDVKPANIIFDHEGNAFLSDFGIALEIAESDGPEAALSPGSSAYASPEQLRREKLSAQADVYSFGVVLSECIDPGESNDVITAAIAQAIATEPNDRFSCIDEFLEALDPAGVAMPGGAANEVEQAVVLAENPYKGLRAFGPGDDAQFFGRERLVSELVQRLSGESVESRCVVLVGPSGSGKSSVVRAGLIPAIRRGEARGSEEWFVSTMVPGVDPYRSLEAALLRVAASPQALLLQQLRDGPRGILRGVRQALGSDGAMAFLAIDQFEELFVGAAQDCAHDFLEALTVAVREPDSPLRLAITIRADFYDRPLGHPSFASIIKACAVEVTPLAPDELERVIVEPAARVGVAFEPGLVSNIAAEMVGQPAALPLLQYTLSELFDRRDNATITSAAYDELGGIAGALAARAEAIYASADAERREAIRPLFGRMTDPISASADVRRRVPISELLQDDPTTHAVVEDFGAARLFTFGRDRGTREPTVEVAHEALLRCWPRLVNWLQEDRELLQSIATLSVAADQWDSAGRETTDLYRGWRLDNAAELYSSAPERFRELDRAFHEASEAEARDDEASEARRVVRLRRLVGAMAVALVFAVVAGSFAFQQSSRASERATEAELATLISSSAAQVGANPDLGLLLALEAHRRDPSVENEQAILATLGSGALANRIAAFEPLNDPECGNTTLHRDGSTEYGVADGRLVSRSTETGTVVDHGPAPAPCVRWLGDAELDQRVAVASDGQMVWIGPLDGPWQVERPLDRPVVLASRSLTAANRLLLRTNDAGQAALVILDGSTGESVGEIQGVGVGRESVATSQDGMIIAVSSGFDSFDDGLNRTVIADGETGEELARIESEEVLVSLVIDADASELVAASRTSRWIRTFDLGTGMELAAVQSATPSIPVDGGLAIRADGSLIKVTESQIEIVDRRLGPIGLTSPVHGAASARLRDDGAVVTVTSDGQVTVVDPLGSSIVSQTWEIEPVSQVQFGEGRAVVVKAPAAPQVVDLTTGVRSQAPLLDSIGAEVPAFAGWPYRDGLWTVGPTGLNYWEDGVQVARAGLSELPTTGNNFDGRGAVLLRTPVGFEEIEVVDFEEQRVVLSVPAPFSINAVPTADGGLHVLYRDGRLQTVDADGAMVDEFRVAPMDAASLEISPNRIVAVPIGVDPRSGRLAMPGLRGEALVVDPVQETTEILPGVQDVNSVGFARGGTMLVISQDDGTVSLWDLERGRLAGSVSIGAGQALPGVPWYDEENDSAWVAGGTQLLEIPLDPAAWVERACALVSRDLTAGEWEQFVPGDESQQTSC